MKSRWKVLGVAVALGALALPKTSWACPGSQDKGCAIAGNSTTLDLGIGVTTQQKQMVQQTDAASLLTATPVAMAAPVTSRYETSGATATTHTVAQKNTLRFSGYHATQIGTLEQPAQRAIDKAREIDQCCVQSMTTMAATQDGMKQKTYITPRATVDRTSADATMGIESCVLKLPTATQPSDHRYTAASGTATPNAQGREVLKEPLSTSAKSGGYVLVGDFVWVGGTSTDPITGVTLTSSGTWHGPALAPVGTTKTGISADP